MNIAKYYEPMCFIVLCCYGFFLLTKSQKQFCRYEYRWADGVQIKKPIEVSAPKYVEYLMDWIETQLDDETLFPQRLGNNNNNNICQWDLKQYPLLHPNMLIIYFYCFFAGAPFPQNFKDVVKTIFKRLFRVYAHIYHSHFQKIVSLKEEAHLNTCFKHFILFTHVSFFSSFSFLGVNH